MAGILVVQGLKSKKTAVRVITVPWLSLRLVSGKMEKTGCAKHVIPLSSENKGIPTKIRFWHI